jgi:hypothetical protein
VVLTWWWLAVAAAFVLVAVGVRAWRRAASAGSAVPAAHTGLLDRSPRYRALARAEATSAVVALAGVCLLALGGLLLGGRLALASTSAPEQSSRDIMLCLDVSSSMTDTDSEVVAAYSRIIDRLRGDRIGLVLWSGAAVPAFPLTDDYGFVKSELARATTAFERYEYDYIAGTVLLRRRASSQIGDGLASCIQRFDRTDEKRSRVVVLASDNDIQGPPILTLDQAADLATRRDVVVHCIAPSDGDPALVGAFRSACERTGGTLAALGDDGSADRIVDQVERLARTPTPDQPQVLVNDRPAVGTALALAGLVLLVAAPLRRRWVR